MYKVAEQILRKKEQFKRQSTSYENFVGGNWSPPEGLQYYPARLPVEAAKFEQKLPRSGSKDINLALSGAKHAVTDWARVSPADRCAMIQNIAKELLSEKEELVKTDSLEEGQNISDVRHELEATLKFYSRQKIIIPTLMVQSQEGQQQLLKAGSVIKQISPVCSDINGYLERVFTILAGGHCLVNCVLLEEDYTMPYALLRFIDVAGGILPKGVLNVIFGLASEAGSTLVYSNRAITAFYIRSQSSVISRTNKRVLH